MPAYVYGDFWITVSAKLNLESASWEFEARIGQGGGELGRLTAPSHRFPTASGAEAQGLALAKRWIDEKMQGRPSAPRMSWSESSTKS